ncbi:MAG: alcohol dehydrogenase catalytic domain-containing protein [Opitutaceae bacterium]|jgi:threonine dehydrogenase-like Zn-dependent dehydrogenase
MSKETKIPNTQHAIQLVGPGQLKVNPAKVVQKPGPHQILARVECVGLCFSDLKLLKQFSEHARKSEITSGISAGVLAGIPSYVPGGKPTVPGHEVTCRIVEVGEGVSQHKVGERCLVQTDYRELPTANSNAAFGYNFEGGLQEFVLMDERVVIDSTGERFLIPAPENLSASSIALVEPWACVEDSYVNSERQSLKAGGRLLVVAEAGHAIEGLAELAAKNKPASITAVAADASQKAALRSLAPTPSFEADLAALANSEFDDIVYFGASKEAIELLNDRLAPRALFNVVLGGKKIGKPVSVGIGRVHYGMTRWIGTGGASAAESYRHIPATGEIRPGESILVIGAGGPMGQMHVIRTACSGIPNVSIVGADVDDARIEALHRKAEPLARANHVSMRLVNSQKHPVTEKFSYFALMAPIGALVAGSVRDSKPGCLINIFAGIPAPTRQDLDLDTYIANHCYMFGTSGSVIRDMKIVLQKVIDRQLDTNRSVDAISGIAGAADGIAAVENRTLAGKIVVYPMLHDVGLIPLSELPKRFPTVAAKLDGGAWCLAAEEELLKVAAPRKSGA